MDRDAAAEEHRRVFPAPLSYPIGFIGSRSTDSRLPGDKVRPVVNKSARVVATEVVGTQH